MKTLIYKLGEKVYNAINEAFDFNDISNKNNELTDDIADAIMDESLSLSTILSNNYNISKFPKWNNKIRVPGLEYSLIAANDDYKKSKKGTVYSYTFLSKTEVNTLINAGFINYYHDITTFKTHENLQKYQKYITPLIDALFKKENLIPANVPRPYNINCYISSDNGLIIVDYIYLISNNDYEKRIAFLRHDGLWLAGFAYITGEVDYTDDSLVLGNNDEIELQIKSNNFLNCLLKTQGLASQVENNLQYNRDYNGTYLKTFISADGHFYKWLIYDTNGCKKYIKINDNKNDIQSNIWYSGLSGNEAKKNFICITNKRYDDQFFIQQYTTPTELFVLTITNNCSAIEELLGPNEINGLLPIWDKVPYHILKMNGSKVKDHEIHTRVYSFIKLTDKGQEIFKKLENDKKISPKKLKEILSKLV